MSNKLLRPLFFIFAFLILFQLFSNNKKGQNTQDDIILAGKQKIAIGKEVSFEIQNNSILPITIPSKCPENPLLVERYINGEWIIKTGNINPEYCEKEEEIEILPEEKYLLGFKQWNWTLFNEEGQYRISLITQIDEKEKIYTYEFKITSASMLRQFWINFFYKPIFNILAFLISIIPSKSLGWGIILLTIIIKIILLAPNQKALKAQKQMQKVQPQLEGLKIKYKNDPKRLAAETMGIWKKHKVSPMSSCLPMLIQFPVLIALFYVVKDELNTINPNMLYNTLQGIDLSTINHIFLGIIDLTKTNIIVLPIIVGGLQFFQMKLTLGKTNTNLPATKNSASPLPAMNKMMQYFMPIMIAVFTASLPAAVGLYWGTSTLFGIGQQMVVNRTKD